LKPTCLVAFDPKNGVAEGVIAKAKEEKAAAAKK
jgi:hypothetical protein